MGANSNPLSALTTALHKQNDILSKARHDYLLWEAARKHTEAVLTQQAAGKSFAEKTMNAQGTKDWLEFHLKLARLESVFEFQKLKYEVLDREWLAQHQAFKLDHETIKRG